MPILSVLVSVYLMLNLPSASWVRFILWMAGGFIVYGAYGYRRSRMRNPASVGATTR